MNPNPDQIAFWVAKVGVDKAAFLFSQASFMARIGDPAFVQLVEFWLERIGGAD